MRRDPGPLAIDQEGGPDPARFPQPLRGRLPLAVSGDRAGLIPVLVRPLLCNDVSLSSPEERSHGK